MGTFNTTALLCGLVLLIATLALFLAGRFKPEIQRDSDNVYAVLGVLCSLILLGSISSLSLLMSFQQLLMIGALITLMWENIRLRQPKDPGARRGGLTGGIGGKFDDFRRSSTGRRGGGYEDERPGSSSVYRYEAELDPYDRVDDPRRTPRRIRGSEPSRGYEDDFGEDPRRNPPRRSPRPSLEDAESRRSRDARDGFDEFGDRRPPRRESPSDPRGSDPRAGRRDEWVDPPERRPDTGRSPREDRSRSGRRPGPEPSRSPQSDMPPPRRRPQGGSMDGTPINLGSRPPVEPPMNEGGGPTGSGGPAPNRAPGGARPPLERPPMDRPPLDRPPTNNEGDRRPSSRPPMDQSPSDRPPIDRPPIDRPPLARPPVSAPPRGPQQRPPSNDDDYVDFKPVNPPPDDEFDNSSNFDD